MKTLQDCYARHAQRAAMQYDDNSMTYAELAASTQPYAASLSAQGVCAGMRVALLCTTTPACVIAMHALIWLGATLQPLHARQPRAALRAQLQLLRSAAVLDPDGSLNDADSASLDPDIRLLRWQQMATAPPPCAVLSPEHVLTVLLTSGSTAAAKPVSLTLANHLASAAAVAERLQQISVDCWLLCLPLHHIGGLAIVLRSLICGSSLYLLPRFDALAVRRLLATRADITLASMVPTMLQRLLADQPAPVVSGLRALLIGGAPASAELLQRAQTVGLPVLPTYGMTEACSQLATLAPEQAATMDFSQAQGFVGTPLSGVQLALINAHGQLLAQGQTGRILARGAMISRAVLQQQALPAVWQQQGWLLTDDHGWLAADGTLHISHRHSDVIISGGENILRSEIEHALLQTGLLSDVAVIGQDDAEWGQIVVALVVPRDPQQRMASAHTQQALIKSMQASLRRQLDPIKLPRRWCVLAALPRTETGKLRQQDAQLLARLAAADGLCPKQIAEHAIDHASGEMREN